MKLIIVATFLAVVCVVLAKPKPKPQAASLSQDPVAQILRAEFEQEPAGAYKYNFETDNGISRAESGDFKTIQNEEGNEEQVIVMRGSYSYVDPSGELITVNYIADETGFHAEGNHIPKAERR